MSASLVIAGVTSGCGKTTLTAAIIAALRRRGLSIQPFKAGPDYIDPGYHSRAAGVPTRNLDTWLLARERLRDLYRRAASRIDLAIVEGMMGLFDGFADGDEGSTAHLAKLLDAPVVVVIDASKTSRSAAAVALGVRDFDPELRVAGFLLNGVASERHREWTAGPIERATGLPVLGTFPHRDDLALPERHLGLVPTAEGGVDDNFFDRLASQAEQALNLDQLLALARASPDVTEWRSDLFPSAPVVPRCRIALAVDEAFNFYYEDNLDLLRAWGAELVPFSPLRDQSLPDDAGGLYIGGGFPELYAAQLAENTPMLRSVRAFAALGRPVYAECGGLMYLCQGIVDAAGARHALAGVLPGWSVIDRPRLSLGYRTATALRPSFLLDESQQVRGHEFHWSQWQCDGAVTPAYAWEQGGQRREEGHASGSLLASYLHVHFGTDRRLAPRFVEACAR